MTAESPISTTARVLTASARLPAPIRHRAIELVFGTISPFFRTTRMQVAEFELDHVTLRLRPRRRVRNHIRSTHSIAVSLACEYACGLVLAQHVPAGRVIVNSTIHLQVHRAAQGTVLGTASLTPEQIDDVRTTANGRMRVEVTVADERGDGQSTGYMDMAWFPPRST